MLKRLLFIHEFGVIRRIVTNYVQSELGDVAIDTAATGAKGLSMLKESPFDVVLCPMEMNGMDGLSFREEMRRFAHHRDTAFILMTSTHTDAQMQRLARHGVDHYLMIPFDAMELKSVIERSLDMRSKRNYQRYGLAGAVVTISSAGMKNQAYLVNLSRGGMMCDIQDPDPALHVLKPVDLTIHFPERYGGATAADVKAVLLRLHVSRWNGDDTPSAVTTAWMFTEMNPQAAEAMERAIVLAARELREDEKEAGYLR